MLKNKIITVNRLLGLILLITAFVLSMYEKGFGKTLWLIAIISLILFIGFLLLLFSTKKHKEFSGSKFLFGFFIIYSLWLFIEPYSSTWFDLSRMSAWVLLFLPATFFITSIIKLNDVEQKMLIYSYLLIGIWLFLWSCLHFYVTRDRPSGPLIDTNVFSGILLFFLLPVVSYLLVVPKEKSHNVRLYDYLFIYTIFGFIGFFATRSRSGIIAFVVVFFLFNLKLIKDYRFKKIKNIIVIFLIIIISFGLVKAHLNFVSGPGVANLDTDKSFQTRLELWDKGLEIFSDNSKLGIGFGQFKEYYRRYRTPVDDNSAGDYVHNDYIQFLVEGGVIQLGLITILCCFIIILYFRLFFEKPNKNNKNIALFTLISVCCVYFIQACANFIFYIGPVSILIGLLLGLLGRFYSDNKVNLVLKNKFMLPILAIILAGISFLFIDLGVQRDYLNHPANLEKTKSDLLFFKSEVLQKVRPKSIALSRYRFLYVIYNASNDSNRIHKELENVFSKNRNDPKTLYFLAKFAAENKEIYSQLSENFKNSKYYLDSEALYKQSMASDPSLLNNYFALRSIYRDKHEELKAYNLLKNGLYSRFYYGESGLFQQIYILEIMIKDAIELGYREDAEEYALLINGINPCNKTVKLNFPLMTKNCK